MAVFGLMAVATAPQALAKTHNVRAAKVVHVRAVHGKRVAAHDPTIYDSIIDPNPGNVPSTSYEANAIAQFGNQITFGGSARVLDDVTVQLSSWGCEQGGWSTPAEAAFPLVPANGTIVQQAPGVGSTTSAGWATFTDNLNTTGGNGPVTFTTTVTSPNISVSSSGAVTTVGNAPGSGPYTVSGTDSDTPNSDTGVWSYTLDLGANPCLTTPGTTFTEPITLNIYNVGPASAHGPSTAGSLIASETQTSAIPYRPSEDDTHCTGSKAGAWYDTQVNPPTCFHGLFTSVQFNFGHVALPNSVIYGIAYNTSDWGAAPYGDATACHTATDSYVAPAKYDDCGYDSLNVASSEEPGSPSVGSDSYPGTAYMDVVAEDYAVNVYCDGGAAGINVFRIDEPANYPTGNGTTSGCWSVSGHSSPWYVPAVQFNAISSPAAIITSANSASVVAGRPFSFTVTTTGIPTPRITEAGKLPHGLTFTNNGNGTATIAGKALTTNLDKAYVLKLRAVNLPTGGRNRQTFTLTLTGGRA